MPEKKFFTIVVKASRNYCFMKKEENFTLNARIESFRFAFRGLASLFKNEHNSRIHLLAAAAVIILGAILGITRFEWCVIVLVIGFVFTAELINTSLESLADIVHPDISDAIRQAKDYSAAAVLIAAIVSVVAGCLIFIPRILELMK